MLGIQRAYLVTISIVVLGLGTGIGRSEAQTSGVCEATAYGLSTSAADNTAALTSALQACGGRTLHISAGTYKFSPAQFIRGIVIPGATSIIGDGAAATTLAVTGPGNYDSFLWIRDASNVSIRGLTLQGNGVPYQAGSCTYDYGRAISIYSGPGASAPVTNISVASNLVRNFTGSGWISIYAAPGSPGIGTIPAGANISIEGNFFQSSPGDSPAPGNPNCNSSAVQIFGGDTVPNVVNVTISANGMDASYLKQGIIVYGSASQVTIAANSISETGQKLPANKDSSLYGVIIYQKELPPNLINVVGNQILDPFSCGVYVAAGRNITINGNRVSGQIDSNDAIEPKAAICLNQMDNGHDGQPATILGNTITGSRIGIAIAEGTVPNVRQNSISQIPSGGIGIKIVADHATSVSLIDNSVSTLGTNVSGLLGNGTPSSLAIVDLFLTGTAYPSRWYRDPSGAQPVCNFSDVGSFRGVFQRTAAAQTFTAQTRFSMSCK
jgi:hypothetical protein